MSRRLRINNKLIMASLAENGFGWVVVFLICVALMGCTPCSYSVTLTDAHGRELASLSLEHQSARGCAKAIEASFEKGSREGYGDAVLHTKVLLQEWPGSAKCSLAASCGCVASLLRVNWLADRSDDQVREHYLNMAKLTDAMHFARIVESEREDQDHDRWGALASLIERGFWHPVAFPHVIDILGRSFDPSRGDFEFWVSAETRRKIDSLYENPEWRKFCDDYQLESVIPKSLPSE